MKHRLFLKLLLAYVIFALFSFLLVATFSNLLIRERVMREEAASLYTEAGTISRSYAASLYQSESTIESVYAELRSLAAYLSSSIWIVNPSGTVLLTNEGMSDLSNPRVIENFTPQVTENTYYTTGYFFGEFSQEQLIVFSPITSNYKIQGYVILLKPLSSLSQRINSYLTIVYITVALIFLLSLIILLFFTEMFYRPLQNIIYATEQYAEGNMHYEFSVDSYDEMGYLAGTLGYMASEIAQSEDVQKKFIANVSHDFRSPLTSIRGYLEAMLDGTIEPSQHEKYLQIVMNETDRLTKLTNSLLQLNNLNTKGIALNRTIFDINSMIHDTLETFEGTCQKKGIHINLILTGEEMYVDGDKDKLQQVLYNLLDNAIKFSHHDSEIKIETTVKKNKLMVSVKDSGIGIPKDSIGLIFDRFYKTDLSRGKDKKGTGLGLSIVKEILRSHNENINVISTEGVGTEFIFTVALADDEPEEVETDETEAEESKTEADEIEAEPQDSSGES
ncbi:MAG: GHKL domain-containing protein [Lachnospiraceae bacterium]|nr:GHKL domain-containing protein [Lachnospiraceae bacterium]